MWERLLDSSAPAAGAAVMGTGIVSVALALDRAVTVSRALLVIAAAIWVALALALPARAARDRAGFLAEARTPSALTASAATAVLGTRLAILGWEWAAVAALVIAAVVWAALLPGVLAMLERPTVGASLLLVVATESIAVLGAQVAVHERLQWLLVAGLVPLVLGLGLYAYVIARFHIRQLAVGRGDHWITGGALAISTLAAGQISAGGKALGVLGDGGGALEALAIALWVLTMLWLPALLVAELRWPRFRYDISRWSTVFPVGMYATCSFIVGAVAGAAAIRSFARVWVWVALAVWVAVFSGMLGRAIGAAEA